jgi:hypothetical protein
MGQFHGHLDSIRKVGYSKAYPFGYLPLYKVENSKENPFQYSTDNGFFICLANEMYSDGASIPWPANLLLKPLGDGTDHNYLRPAIIHDALYQAHCKNVLYAGPEFGDVKKLHDVIWAGGEEARAWADKVFYDAMIDSGVNKAVAKIMYQAVKQFGQGPWNRHKKDGR